MKRFYLPRFPGSILVFIMSFTACASPYYGYNKEEWEKLSKQQQQVVKKEFEEIQKKKKDLQHDQLLRERDEQIIRRGLGEPY